MSSRKTRVKPFGMVIRSGSPGSILSRLYRTILHDLGITLDRYNALMARYIARAQLDVNRIEKANARTTLSKELLKDSMTWKTFVRGLDFLNVSEYTLKLSGLIDEKEVTTSLVMTEFQESKVGEGLAKLFLQLRESMGLDVEDYRRLMIAYMQKNYSKEALRDGTAVRSSFMKEIAKPCITWTTLIKGLVFLGMTKITLDLTLKHEIQRTTYHQTTVVIDAIAVDGGDEEGE